MNGVHGHWSTTPAVYPEPGPTREVDNANIVIESSLGSWTEYRGSADDLVAVGLAPAEMFATVGKSGTKSARILCGDGAKLKISLQRVGRGEWRVRRWHARGNPPLQSGGHTFTPGDSAAYDQGRNYVGIDVKRAESWDSYTGTKDALINAGLATEAMFPTLSTRLKYRHCLSDSDNNNSFEMARIKGGRFKLRREHENRKSCAPARTVASSPSLQSTLDRYEELFAVEALFEGMRDWIAEGCPPRDAVHLIPWSMRFVCGQQVFGSDEPFDSFLRYFLLFHGKLYEKLPNMRGSARTTWPAGSAEDYFGQIFLAAKRLAKDGSELWADYDPEDDDEMEDTDELSTLCTTGAVACRKCFEAMRMVAA